VAGESGAEVDAVGFSRILVEEIWRRRSMTRNLEEEI
jgi:hypothetical protein